MVAPVVASDHQVTLLGWAGLTNSSARVEIVIPPGERTLAGHWLTIVLWLKAEGC